MNKGVGILTTDIYLKFPCISRDEVEALQEFVNEEHIEVEGCSYIIDENKNLQQRIDKAMEYIGLTEEDLENFNMYDVNGVEVYKILRGKNENPN